MFSPSAHELDIPDQRGHTINDNIAHIYILHNPGCVDPERTAYVALSSKERLLLNLSIASYFQQSLTNAQLKSGMYADIHDQKGMPAQTHIEGPRDYISTIALFKDMEQGVLEWYYQKLEEYKAMQEEERETHEHAPTMP